MVTNRICFPAIFHPEEVGYSVSVPDFDKAGYGCFTEGDTFEQAYDMAFEAIGICLEDIIANGEKVPEATKPELLEKEAGDFVVPVMFEMNEYEKRSKPKLVKKTLTIPEWLNELAEKQNVNFSNVLKNALADQLNIGL